MTNDFSVRSSVLTQIVDTIASHPLGHKKLAMRMLQASIADGNVLVKLPVGDSKIAANKKLEFTTRALISSVFPWHDPVALEANLKNGSNIVLMDEFCRWPSTVSRAMALSSAAARLRPIFIDTGWLKPFVLVATTIDSDYIVLHKMGMQNHFQTSFSLEEDEKIGRYFAECQIGFMLNLSELGACRFLVKERAKNTSFANRGYAEALVHFSAPYLSTAPAPHTSVEIQRMFELVESDLLKSAAAASFLDGRDCIEGQDIFDVAHDVLAHRFVLEHMNPGENAHSIITKIIAAIGFVSE